MSTGLSSTGGLVLSLSHQVAGGGQEVQQGPEGYICIFYFDETMVQHSPINRRQWNDREYEQLREL